MTTPWTEKYRPKTLAEVRGNNSARDEFREWAETWDDHREAVIIHGSPGVGKTSAAHALASDFGWETIELNASDHRTADVIDRIAGEAAMSGTLTDGSGGRKLLILDEADNLHGNADRGGTRAITQLVKKANQPVVLIANEFYDMSQGLRNASRDIEFRDIQARSILPVLRDICRREDIEYEDGALDALAEKNAGDLRGAINDLQAIAETAGVLRKEDVVTGSRDRTTGIFQYLDDLFKTADAETARRESFAVDETPDDLINWIEDNVPKEYDPDELVTAYEFLALADKWLGRVRETQNYGYWRYATDTMTAGVAAARREQRGGWTRWSPPGYWSKLGRTRGTRDTRDYIARKIAERSGTSMGTARRHIMPFLAVMTHHCTNRELTVAMATAYELDEKHVSFITGSGANTKKVERIVEEAEDRRRSGRIESTEDVFEARDESTAMAPADDDDPTDDSDEEDEEQASFTDFV